METKLKLFFLVLLDAVLLTIVAALIKTDLVSIFLIYFFILLVSLFISLRILNKKLIESELSFEAAKRENREAIKMRTDFVTNVTHELKTPLTSISGYVETLQNGAIHDEEARLKFLNIISEETKRLNRLIENILALSYLENYKEEDVETFIIYDEIDSLIHILKPIADIKKISIYNKIDKKYKISGKKDKFRQMMLNLMENSIKYGKERGNTFIKAREGKDFLVISVIDDGIGISSKEIDRITERFYRVDKSRAKLVEGTGLGLSIVKHTASLFGGELSVKSKEDEGSEFSISISKSKITTL